MAAISKKQQRFADEYLVDMNATQAAIRAGYSAKTAKSQGSRLLTNVDVISYMQSRMKDQLKRTELTQDEVIEDLRELRDICMGRKPIKIMTVVKNSREGTAEPVEIEGAMFEPAAANRALELLGKRLQMFTDKVDHISSDGSMTPQARPTKIVLEAGKADGN